uniref:Helitron helicase-like domain-containing protein n=1 Tax=Tanacetum cinerariifolium TaxID=118510 RepID=A0A6L2L3J8_TANCI|nr:helitron helicase-like domain-containing protein [Tanacetum cinerariifolium]
MSHFGGDNNVLRRDIVEGLIDLLDAHNALVQLFRTARENFEDTHIPNFNVRLYNVIGAQEYELPTRDMLGAIVYETSLEAEMDYDIVLKERSAEILVPTIGIKSHRVLKLAKYDIIKKQKSAKIFLGKPTTDNSLAVPKRTFPEIFSNISPEDKAHYNAEAKAIHLILIGIGEDIYSPVDACKTAHYIFTSRDAESIESYYFRFYKMMNEMVRNQLEVSTIQVNVQLLQQLQPEWSRFVTVVKQTVDLDKESYHKLFDILKQYEKEVNEIHTHYQTSKPQKSYAPPSKQSSSTISHTTTRHKGKKIAKPIIPPTESASEEDSNLEQAQRDKDMQKNLALIAKYFKKLYKPNNNNLITFSNSGNKNVDTTPRYINDNQTGQFRNQRTMTVAEARETVGSQVVQQTRIQCFNCKEFRHFAKECRKPKRAKYYTYHNGKMLLWKQAEKGVSLQAKQND